MIKFEINTKTDFALMLRYRENITYEQSMDICNLVEKVCYKNLSNITLKYLIELLIKLVKICVVFIKSKPIETSTFYNKFIIADSSRLPLIINNYSKIFKRV